ncbi:hypothetical protein J7F01_07475 [Streptomyces sp. ISL-22]|uniref:hypothetical protein n=1 Tax=unclassified Streptomyces TaxID=2593676 RepID=UPI001BECCCBC|nr:MULTISPECIES: hypothetical protein [unclassified Streptomyces]MBT2418344.1 hypothetical protein [Streptomyces sp. ISL-24]MBT2432040.1 hypothetical protein [Streptomyces sp. ISL-22]
MQGSRPRPSPTGDRHWRADVRFATGCALTFLVMTLLVDWDAETLTPLRALLWLALTTLLFVILLPERVTAGPGWLTVRGLVRRQAVRTDALVAVRQHDDVSARLTLRDTDGSRLELDPRILVANPLLWHELDTGVRRSHERGTLREGTDVLERLRRQIDDATALAVLRASGIS